MGRVITSIEVRNVASPLHARKFDVMVDAGASHLTLPSVWKKAFGAFQEEQAVEMQVAAQEVVLGTMCGPVRIQVEGFRAIHSEVLFIDMASSNGEYEPLLGYIPLEQCGAAVDLIGHRLVRLPYLDLKYVANPDGRRDVATS